MSLFRTLSVEEMDEYVRRADARRRAEFERRAAWDRVLAKQAAARRRAEKLARDRAAARQAKRAGPARERRSRIDWAALVGERDVVIRQHGWERNTTALAMRDAGLTFAAIGEHMGVTVERARQRVAKAQRVRKRPEHRSPVEHFERGAVAFQLAQEFSPRELARLAGSLQAFAYPGKRDWLLVGSQHVRHHG